MAAPGPASSPVATLPSYATEQEWIVTDVARAIASMADYARQGTAPRAGVEVATAPLAAGEPPAGVSFLVSIDGAPPIRLTVAGHLWDPATYVPLAAALVGGAVRPAQDGPANDPFVSALTEPRVPVLLTENDRLSALLADRFTSARLHEQAALLVGAFALREVAEVFADVRPALSRMAAHLAFARALDPAAAAGPSGALARVTIDVLAGRQADAVVAVRDLERRGGSDAERAWLRALTMRATGDWRVLPSPVDGTLLERLEYARAVRTRLSANRLLDFLESVPLEDVVDWQRLVLLPGFTVEAANRFAEDGLDAELAEAREVWAHFHEGPADDARVLADLNDVPAAGPAAARGGRITVRVLDWGAWAAFEQRHVCAHLAALVLRSSKLGLPDEAREMVAGLEPTFGALTLFPAALAYIARQASDFERGVAGARELRRLRPERLTAAVWNLMASKRWFMDAPLPFPPADEWFRPWSPPGTAFDLANRGLYTGGGCDRASVPELERWAAMAPYDMWTVWSLAWRRVDGKPSLADVRQAFGPIVGYDRDALLHMYDYLDASPAEYESLAHAFCDIDADQCDRLAAQLLLDGREIEAANAYERWIDRARDLVAVSNQVSWLAHYYWDNGRPERAEELARMAGWVYSSAGLETLGDQLDRMGRYDEAEEQYRRRFERYSKAGGPLGAFYLRRTRQTGDRSHEAEALELLREWFPDGLEPLGAAPPSGPPADGVEFVNFGRRPEHSGLRRTDIIVGLDGYRVRTTNQIYIVGRLEDDDLMRFVVWRDNAYVEVAAPVPQRRLGVTWRTYAPARK